MRSTLPFTLNIDEHNDIHAPYEPPYRLSPNEDAELPWQLEKAWYNGWIGPNSSHYNSPVLFTPDENGVLRICINCFAVNPSLEWAGLDIADLDNKWCDIVNNTKTLQGCFEEWTKDRIWGLFGSCNLHFYSLSGSNSSSLPGCFPGCNRTKGPGLGQELPSNQTVYLMAGCYPGLK